jgi:hypothetical protein
MARLKCHLSGSSASSACTCTCHTLLAWQVIITSVTWQLCKREASQWQFQPQAWANLLQYAQHRAGVGCCKSQQLSVNCNKKLTPTQCYRVLSATNTPVHLQNAFCGTRHRGGPAEFSANPPTCCGGRIVETLPNVKEYPTICVQITLTRRGVVQKLRP